MYAIVDIETTGGHASANGITEVAILLHDGKEVYQHYKTLVNPGMPIPVYITALTGISNEMVLAAPRFRDIASEIYDLLKDKIFVAHNVNFDYSFLRHHLNLSGYELQCKKLCTVRMGRKILPGYPSYSLGRLCKSLNIEIEERHRASGDARATAQLFSLLLEKDTEGHIQLSLNRSSKEQQLPPNLNKGDLNRLPAAPGVYYFNDQKGKPIYVGKALNVRKRVLSHFSGNNPGRQRQEFMRNIHSIDYKQCGTELIAFILEAAEINRLWPANNRALKRFGLAYGLYVFEDQKGYLRLAVDKKRKHARPVYSFGNLAEGNQLLQALMTEFELCPKLCFIQRNTDPCQGVVKGHCRSACQEQEEPEMYNQRVSLALEGLKASLPTFSIVDNGRTEEEKSIILMEKGQLKGIGYVPGNFSFQATEELKELIEPFSSTDYVQNLIHNYASRHPEKVYHF